MKELDFSKMLVYDFSNLNLQEGSKENCFCDSCDNECDSCDTSCDCDCDSESYSCDMCDSCDRGW